VFTSSRFLTNAYCKWIHTPRPRFAELESNTARVQLGVVTWRHPCRCGLPRSCRCCKCSFPRGQGRSFGEYYRFRPPTNGQEAPFTVNHISNEPYSQTPACRFRFLRDTYWWLVQSSSRCSTSPEDILGDRIHSPVPERKFGGRDAQEPIIQYPVDSFSFGWLDGISISQDTLETRLLLRSVSPT
jgi:hypothetical protein